MALLAMSCLVVTGVGVMKSKTFHDTNCRESDAFLLGDVEALSNGEVGIDETKFKTWIDHGRCMEKRNGKMEEVATYRICGEVDLGFSHSDDCSADEDCKTGEKE